MIGGVGVVLYLAMGMLHSVATCGILEDYLVSRLVSTTDVLDAQYPEKPDAATATDLANLALRQRHQVQQTSFAQRFAHLKSRCLK